ncbi:unnamed protein product [Sphacelaria rigidula]
MAGSAKVERCSQQARTGMVNFVSKRCHFVNCSKQPPYGAAGSRGTESCASHARPGMVDVRGSQCDQEGCSMPVSHNVHVGGLYCERHALQNGGCVVLDAQGTKRGHSPVGACYGGKDSLDVCRHFRTNSVRGDETPPPVSGLSDVGRASRPSESDADATLALVTAPPPQCSSEVRTGVKVAIPFGSGSNLHRVPLNTEGDDATSPPISERSAEERNVEGGEIDSETRPAWATTLPARCNGGIITGTKRPIPFSSGGNSRCTRTRTLCSDASSPPVSGLRAAGGNFESGESGACARPALAIARSPCCTGGVKAGTHPAIPSSSGSDPHCVRSSIFRDGGMPPSVSGLPGTGDYSKPGNSGPGVELASAVAPREHCNRRVSSGAQVGTLFFSKSDPHCVPTGTAEDGTTPPLVSGLPTAGARSGPGENCTDGVASATAPAARCSGGVRADTKRAKPFSRGSNPHSVLMSTMCGDATLPSVSEVPPAGRDLESGAVGADAELALAVTPPARCRSRVSTGSEATNLLRNASDRHFLCTSVMPDSTMAPPVPPLPVAGSNMESDESDDDLEVAIAPLARCSGGPCAVNQLAATFSTGRNIGSSYSNRRGNQLAQCILPWPKPMVNDDTSRPSSLSTGSLSNEGHVENTAAAAAVVGNGDSTADNSGFQAKACMEDLQRVDNATSTLRETAKTKLDLVNLASLVVEACEAREEGDGDSASDDEEDEDMDEDMSSRLASARKAAAVHFSSAAMVVLALAMASEGEKMSLRHGPGADATSEASTAPAAVPSGFAG